MRPDDLRQFFGSLAIGRSPEGYPRAQVCEL